MKLLLRLYRFFDLKSFMVSLIFSVVWILWTDFIVHEYLSNMFSTQLLQTSKGLLYVFILSIILSVLRKREKLLHSSLMATRKQSLVGEFSGMIAHEVKNPLHMISLGVERLEQDHDSTGARQYIHESIDRLCETINFLQLLSKGESLEDVKLDEDIALKQELVRVEKFIVKVYPRLKVDFIYDVENASHLQGNRSLITHLFINLLKNALDYFDSENIENGVVKIRSFMNEDNKKTIIISNSGKPLNVIEQSRLFTHFTSKEGDKGTGLGLILCKEIMKVHDGTIAYYDKLDHPAFILQFN